MTENEATREMTFEEEYQILQKEKEELFAMENCDSETPFANCVVRRSLRCIRKLLEEIQQYRAIGTVEEIQKKMEELERWHTDKINKNIKNPFAYTSTLICHNCDHKDDYIEELEAEVEEYRAINIDEIAEELKGVQHDK